MHLDSIALLKGQGKVLLLHLPSIVDTTLLMSQADRLQILRRKAEGANAWHGGLTADLTENLAVMCLMYFHDSAKGAWTAPGNQKHSATSCNIHHMGLKMRCNPIPRSY